MADTSLGFRFRYRECKAPPTIVPLVCKSTATLTKGDLVSIDTGEIALSATNDSAIAGVVLETKAGVDSTTIYMVIVDDDAVYGVYDASARVIGATLDIAGTTGAMTVAASSNVDLQVVANSSASEETLVKIAHGEHFKN
jgi:methionine aminopeptidase